MAFAFTLKPQITLVAYVIPCAHLCRYCCISSKGEAHTAQFSLQRLHALTARFREWGEPKGYKVGHLSYASDEITDKVENYFNEKLGPPGTRALVRPQDASHAIYLRTGGARLKDDNGIRAWLSRRRDAGCNVVHSSFAGHGKVHDWWNNRQGDYVFLYRVQEIAADMGFEINQTMFTMKNTLPTLHRLAEELERLPKPRDRWAFPAAYTGRNRSRMAHQFRITEEDRESLFTDSVIGQFIAEKDRAEWKSEREEIADTRERPLPARGISISVTDENIDFLETALCDQIVAEAQGKVEASYRTIPSREELRERYGNPDGLEIYGTDGDVERLWFDRWQRQSKARFELRSTHLY